MLSTQAFNALLKTLEEPPEHVIFVLATTEVHKIPETILSRCQRFEFRPATGSMRDAISLLDQMAAGGTVTADYVRLMLGAERREVVRSLLSAWVDRDLTEGLQAFKSSIAPSIAARTLASYRGRSRTPCAACC